MKITIRKKAQAGKVSGLSSYAACLTNFSLISHVTGGWSERERESWGQEGKQTDRKRVRDTELLS